MSAATYEWFLSRRRAPLVVGLLGLAAAVFAGWWVDLSPEVETDFFFAPDDPQLAAANEIEARFPARSQVIVRVGAGSTGPPDLAALSDSLAAVEGVARVYSPALHDVRSPLFGRILVNPDGSRNVVLETDGTDPEVLVPRLERVVDAARDGGLDVVTSGVPVIVELIRRSLFRDLVVFGVAALVLLAGLVALVFRDPAVLAGTLTACLTAVSLTLLATRALDISIGLLTANLVTIVFVLTLSHVVFLTVNWRRTPEAEGLEGAARAARTAGVTLEASFWSMLTTLLGFLSLLAATARPLRELGYAGAVGTTLAMVTAYAVHPVFLARWGRTAVVAADAPPRPPPRRALAALVGLAVIALGTGLPGLDTDPGLLTYFAPGSELRRGLERVDRDGGSSPLGVVVTDASGGRLDAPGAYERMRAFHAALEADERVGVVLSPVLIVEHARTQPLAGFLSVEMLLDLAESSIFDAESAVRAFLAEDRRSARFSLRMRESPPTASREAVVERIEGYAREAGLTPVLVGGLYELQAQLGRLIRTSLQLGLGGLFLLFLPIAWLSAGSGRTAAVMLVCLTGVPLVVLGAFARTGTAMDIITSPAANIALAMGVDSMIHLVVRVRRLRRGGATPAAAWLGARAQVGPAVVAASLIICAGFGIFGLSSFPPTRRFGLAVILGTVTAATMALVVLPSLQGRADVADRAAAA